MKVRRKGEEEEGEADESGKKGGLLEKDDNTASDDLVNGKGSSWRTRGKIWQRDAS